MKSRPKIKLRPLLKYSASETLDPLNLIHQDPTVADILSGCSALGCSISGYVFLDMNMDGYFQRNERALRNVMVQLIPEDSSILAEYGSSLFTFTTPDGYYHFDNLPPGNYSIFEYASPDFATTNSMVYGSGDSYATGKFWNVGGVDPSEYSGIVMAGNQFNIYLPELTPDSASGPYAYATNFNFGMFKQMSFPKSKYSYLIRQARRSVDGGIPVVPEPSTLAMALCGFLAAISWLFLRRRGIMQGRL